MGDTRDLIISKFTATEITLQNIERNAIIYFKLPSASAIQSVPIS